MEMFDVVFEAGGAKGLAFIGALEVLFRARHTIRRLIGCSAGAITATCLAAGYTTQELLEAAREKRGGKPTFTGFLDPPALADFPEEVREKSELNQLLKKTLDRAIQPEPIDKSLKKLPRLAQAAAKGLLGDLNRPLLDALLETRYFVHLFALVETGGLFTDQKFIAWVQEQLRNKGFDKSITLKAFFEKTGRDLSLAVADTSDKELLILNHRTAPQCPVVAAVRMSMSIPFVWPDVAWKEDWGPYRGRAKAGNYTVDGSVLSNFPLRYLVDSANKDVQGIMGPAPAQKARNLGLLLDETKPIPGAENDPEPNKSKFLQRISRLVETVTGTWDEEFIKQYPEEICFIGAKGVGVLEFDMDERRLQTVINSGRCAMTEYLQKRRFR
jgi:predicted acylesterase/phospholipase RssA